MNNQKETTLTFTLIELEDGQPLPAVICENDRGDKLEYDCCGRLKMKLKDGRYNQVPDYVATFLGVPAYVNFTSKNYVSKEDITPTTKTNEGTDFNVHF